MKDTFKTKVIFRKYPNGEILALFPYNIVTNDGDCDSYMHLGQHGAANYRHCIATTKPAKETEYNELFTELENIGYNLQPVLKIVNKR